MVESTQAVREVSRQLSELIRQEIPFQDKARDVLEFGTQYLDADRGYLSQVDERTDQLDVLVSTGPTNDHPLSRQDVDFVDTYCRRTVTEDRLVAIDDATTQTDSDREHCGVTEVGWYLGTPIKVNGELYGTLSFVGAEPRPDPFGDAEVLFGNLTAQILERELVREHLESELSKQINLASVLNRVLRHNLRNDMAVIRGHTQLMAEKLDDDRLSATALRNIDELVELSQKARELDLIIATESEYKPTDVTKLVKRSVETVAESFPEASIEVHVDEPIITAVMPSFERALDELIENAAKHGGETPTVTITVNDVDNTVSVQISDDGPGLADHEAEVLQSGQETPLTHGSGLGLWLAYWIVTSHNGTIDSTVTDEGTTMTVTVPQSPETTAEDGLTQLVRARDQYEAAFEQAPDAMVFLNDEARILDANAEAATIFAKDRQKLLGQSFRKYYQGEGDFDQIWSEITNREKSRDEITVRNANDEEYKLEYASKANFIPGQHILVNRILEADSNS